MRGTGCGTIVIRRMIFYKFSIIKSPINFMAKNLFSKYKPDKPSRAYLAIPIIFLIIYVTYLIGNSLWQHFQINRELERLQTEIAGLEDRKADLEEAIKYYQSESFKEKEARSKLFYQKKGEVAIALPPENNKKESDQESDIFDTTPKTFSLPNYIRWWHFFFKGN